MGDSRVIRAGDNLLLRLPNGELKLVKIPDGAGRGDVKLGKYGIFRSENLLGHPFGLSYEIGEKKALHPVAQKTIEDIEETDATNELINDDGQFVQPLTAQEIIALKESGAHVTVRKYIFQLRYGVRWSAVPQEIIKRQIEAHTNYQLKNEYSKEKYRKRKEAKFSRGFTVVEPTLFNICEYHFLRDPSKIRDLRPHSLGQLLNTANVRPGARMLVCDDVSGLLVAGVLERLGGTGRCIAITDVDGPSAFPVASNMNFEPQANLSILSTINWAAADEDYTPLATVLPTEPAGGEFRSDKERSKLRKRKTTASVLTGLREELFSGEFDGLVVASQFEPFSIIEKLSPYVAGSGVIAVYSPFSQPLIEAQSRMRPIPMYLAPTVTESWHREYQVLPGRTHPHMNMPGAGGFILSAIKVYDAPGASSVLTHRKELRAKRRRLAEEKAAASSSGTAADDANQDIDLNTPEDKEEL
ncbi:tRNA (adenine(58)-N(1))-methyltransferase non-catalytic subunit trm6 [Ceratobasidium sp. 370]|nr:tRNA (adenine(58)-N(1))-methyltransferase non-catalytic subunit trm6 [Ceratobasidium sp. 370]